MDSLKNIFAIPELRNRVLFTFGLLAVYRIGGHIPTPGINTQALQILTESQASNLFGLYDMFSGQNLSKMTVFALGVMPYISASIILQLLTVVWPYLERLSKEGELGRRKITQYTRYGTIFLSLVQSLGIAFFLENASKVPGGGGLSLVFNPGWGFRLMTVLTLTTGSVLVMWLGEQITERGIGNGMSLLIYAGIVVGLPKGALTTLNQLRTGEMGLLRLALLLILMIVVVAAIVFMERGNRRVTVQYARRMVGRRMYGGASTHIPLKVNTGGVMPVIFASSILAFPQTLRPMFEPTGALANRFVDGFIQQITIGYPLYNLIYVALIIFFAYFYTAIIFNPDDVAENMRKYGGFVPGIRPGKRTAEHIDAILARITLAGAIYLAVIALLPEFMLQGFKVQPIPFIGDRLDAILPRFVTEGMNVTFYFGGTSLLIIVGVAMDTVQQVESQLIMRHYDGFMKKTPAAWTSWVRRVPVRVVMLGPPGAGKGTQAERFAKERGIPRISTGDILRDAVQEGTPLGQAARAVMDAGRLVGDDIMIGIVRERLSRPDAATGFVLDGFPRTTAQAEALDTLVDARAPIVVVDIEVPEETLIARLATRRICGTCGWNASPAVAVCSRCGGTLVPRTDDGEVVVRERLRVYARDTQPIVDFYCHRPTFRSVDGDQTPDAVAGDIAAAVAAALGGRP